MLLIFKYNNEILKTVPVLEGTFDQVVFGTNQVKEICINNTVNNSDEYKLEDIYNKIHTLDYSKITEIILYCSQDNFFAFHFPIKDVYYRNMAYMRSHQLETIESISIRFKEDNIYYYNPQTKEMKCNKDQCVYFKNNHCLKYDASLLSSGYVCKQCFLEMEHINHNYYAEICYEEMIKERK